MNEYAFWNTRAVNDQVAHCEESVSTNCLAILGTTLLKQTFAISNLSNVVADHVEKAFHNVCFTELIIWNRRKRTQSKEIDHYTKELWETRGACGAQWQRSFDEDERNEISNNVLQNRVMTTTCMHSTEICYSLSRPAILAAFPKLLAVISPGRFIDA